jgi:hypothetical protein
MFWQRFLRFASFIETYKQCKRLGGQNLGRPDQGWVVCGKVRTAECYVNDIWG